MFCSICLWCEYFFLLTRFTRKDQGEDVDAGASTSNNISGYDINEVSPKKKPNKMKPTSLTTTKMEIIDTDNVMDVSDDVVLVHDDTHVEDLFGELSRNLDAMPPNFLQIESVESLHPSLFDESHIVIDDSL